MTGWADRNFQQLPIIIVAEVVIAALLLLLLVVVVVIDMFNLNIITNLK